MKKIVLIGASGFIGSAILKESLDRGHTVTAIVRHPEKLALQHPGLRVKPGDVLSGKSLAELMLGGDIVVSAYNPGWLNPQIAPETTRGYQAIISAVKEAKISRLIVVGGAGSLYASSGERVMDTGEIPESYLPAIEALAGVLYHLQQDETELDWAFFSPAGNIHSGERTGKFRLGKDELIVDELGQSNISVQDYAMALLDEVEKPTHHRERFTIGY